MALWKETVKRSQEKAVRRGMRENSMLKKAPTPSNIKNWITIRLDGSVGQIEIVSLLDNSHELTKG